VHCVTLLYHVNVKVLKDRVQDGFLLVDLSEKIFLANECLFIYATRTRIWFSSHRRTFSLTIIAYDEMTLASSSWHEAFS